MHHPLTLNLSLYLELLSYRSRPESSQNVPNSDTDLPACEKDLDSIVVTPVLSTNIVSDANVAATASCTDTDRNANEALVAVNSTESQGAQSSGKDDINTIYSFMNTMTTLLGKIVDKKNHDISQATLDKF